MCVLSGNTGRFTSESSGDIVMMSRYRMLGLTLAVFLVSFPVVHCLDPYFWHITDLHLDPGYHGDDAINSCNDVIDSPGIYGDYECDAPYALIKAALKALTNHGREPEFILYTGDTAPHMKNYTAAGWGKDVVISFLQNVTDLFKETFPDIRFAIALGNHDYYPKNQLPGESNEIYVAAADMWSSWLDDDAIATLKTGGYYTQLMDADSGLRVVVTNSHLYADGNLATEGSDDPGGQYAWLHGVLTAARTAGEKVHFAVHTPPGVVAENGGTKWLREQHNEKFTDVISEYSDVIMGAYSAHEHLDTFRLFYKEEKPGTTLFVAPSVTPWRSRHGDGTRGPAHNPGVRKVSMDPENGHLSDIEQFYLDLPKANTDQEAVWLSLYSYRKVYVGLNNLTAASMDQLVHNFEQYGNNDFHNYYDFNTVKSREPSNGPCSCLCKFTHICSMLHVKYADFDDCYANIECDAAAVRASVIAILSVVTLWKLLL